MQELSQYSISADPIETFSRWRAEALKADEGSDAFALATASREGIPSNRYLLLKDIEDDKFVFFTNYLSNKAKDITANPIAEMAFYWPKTLQQIRILGTLEKTSRAVSESYFSSRDLDSQLASYCSIQSHPIKDKKELLDKFQSAQSDFPDGVPCPENWGGYYLTPQRIEFFIYGEHRLNDRFVFEKEGDRWSVSRVQP